MILTKIQIIIIMLTGGVVGFTVGILYYYLIRD